MAEPSKGIPISMVALSGRVDLEKTARTLKWPELRRYPYGSVYAPDTGGRLYLFGFGAVVLDAADKVDEAVLKVLEAATELRRLPDTAETYYLAEDPQRGDDGARVGWDQVVIHERSPELVGAIALLLGQSAALERYEHAANALMDEALEMTKALARTGASGLSGSTQVRRVGRIMSDRLEMARWFYLVDKPAETWEDARVARLYDLLFRNLELEERHRAMLHKLQAVETVMEMHIELLQARRSQLLEWLIIALIALEIILALTRGGH